MASPDKSPGDILVIRRQPPTAVPPSRQVAAQLFRLYRQLGATGLMHVAVVENPEAMMPAVRKQWLDLTRRLQRQAATTLDEAKRQALSSEFQRLQQVRFLLEPEDDEPEPGVIYFLKPDQAALLLQHS